MPHVISILNPKGGAGKTTLVTNVATALHRRGSGVLIIDTDPQATARDWRDAANGTAEKLPGVIGGSASMLGDELGPLTASYDYVLIDGSAKTEGVTGAAVRAADVVLIPVRPSPADLWAVADLVEIIQARRQVADRPKAAFVISAAPVGANVSDQVAEALEAYELPIFESRTGQRVAYAETLMGSTVLERPGSKAAAEIEAVTDELIAFLEDYE